MANKTWKSFEQSEGFRKVKLKFKQLIGKEPNLKIDINLPTQDYFNWKVVPELIRENDIVYSIGICDDIGFEIAMLEKKNVSIFAFDPTPYSVNWMAKQKLPANLQFFPWAVSDKDGQFFLYPRIKSNGKKSEVMFSFHQQEELRDDGISVDAYTLESMVNKLEHKAIDILKMDVEGAEYDVIDNMLNSSLRPKLLLIEFHHRFKGIGKAKTTEAVKALRKAGYLVVNISSTGREVSFVHQSSLANL